MEQLELKHLIQFDNLSVIGDDIRNAGLSQNLTIIDIHGEIGIIFTKSLTKVDGILQEEQDEMTHLVQFDDSSVLGEDIQYHNMCISPPKIY